MKYVCDVCGYEYDEALGDPDNGIAPGTKWKTCRTISSVRSAVSARTISQKPNKTKFCEPVFNHTGSLSIYWRIRSLHPNLNC